MTLLIQENVALAPLTTLKVGGAARFFAEAQTENDVLSAILFARENNLPVFVLGGGSNVLISDEGFSGLVLKIALQGVSVTKDGADFLVTAGAGEDWEEFVKFCVDKKLQGVECLSGIPGTIGGTPVQNVGAYGQEVSETIDSVRVLERETNKIIEMTNAECRFSYRTSIFNSTKKNEYIVLGVTFRLRENGQPKIVYKDLQQIFNAEVPSLSEVRQAVLQIRAAKSMVLNDSDPNTKSAGSFFKNPIVTLEELAEIQRRLIREQEAGSVPNFKVDAKHVKIPAAWLIESSGFCKGYNFGKVGLSSRHTLALINLGDAGARDVLDFKAHIQETVRKKFNIRLQPEPVLVGF